MNIKDTFIEVLQAILPITIVVLILQLIIGFSMEGLLQLISGTIFTIIGFTLFLIGTKVSLFNIGELVGRALISKGKLFFILAVGIAIGFAVTVSEPGVQILAEQIEAVSIGEISRYLLILIVSLGVGIFFSLALLRFIFNIPLRTMIFSGYLLVFILSLFAPSNFIPISFDSGGVTTGPMTVPFILSLGVGMTSITGENISSDDSFGFVGLASIGPIIGVLLLGVIFG